ncbi:TrmH family RNA methyltransferase [Marinicrinis sediminis]|uniref:TrmH family RNA methyltransferase n=1 Tax=Marinicrinis sediminis TaxID=1652465 RepID=A0ABW5RB34_9BACL
MRFESIQSVSNPKVKSWSQLLTKKGRLAQGKYMVEGVHLVEEALRSGQVVEALLVQEGKGLPDELQAEEGTNDVPVCYEVTEAIMQKCSDTVTPQGICAIVHKPKLSFSQLLSHPNPFAIVVDRLQDPGNLGTIIRSADAAGASYVLIGQGSVDVYSPKAIRSTMGSLFHLPVVEVDLQEVIPAATHRGIEVYSTSLDGESHCYEYDYTRPTWLVIGNEAQGVSDEVHALVSRQVWIPMQGQAESLNAAMAATILLFEAMRQRSFNK